MRKEEIILIGGGGHCRSVIDIITAENKYKICGIIDKPGNTGKEILGIPVTGTDKDLKQFAQNYKNFIITIGQIKDNTARVNLYNILKELNCTLPVISSPYSIISPYAVIREGSVIMHNAVVNAGAVVGINCIINNNALIEHDSIIGDHCHISTGALINGECKINSGVFIGSGAIIKQGVTISSGCVVGAGAVVTKDLAESGIYAGVPARRINNV